MLGSQAFPLARIVGACNRLIGSYVFTFSGGIRRRCPEVHFEEIAIDLLQARFWPVTWSLPTDSCAESLADPFPAEIRSLRNNLAESSRRYRHMVVPLYKPGGSSPSKCGSYPLKRRHSRRSASRRTSPGTRLRSTSRKSRSPLTAPATLL
jgi:hypothetical protein